jgi:Beta protein
VTLTHLDYVPVLKWRQGEYQALMRLAASHKDRVTPLIEITPPDFDFEAQEPAKSIDDHLRKFGPRLKVKWGARPAFLDTSRLDPTARMFTGQHPLTHLLEAARAVDGRLIPVTALNRDLAHYNAVAAAHQVDQDGVAVRCSLDDVGDGSFAAQLLTLLAQLEVAVDDADLIIDLGRPNFEPVEDLATLLLACLQASPVFQQVRSLVIVATAFPASMADIKGPTQVLPRHEWRLYKALVDQLPKYMRIPTFGDYAIAAPELPQGDMRLMKPSATVRYTIDDAWLISKGSNVRDNGFEQYEGQCHHIASLPSFLGVGYSAGGDYIHQCGLGLVSTGTLTTWRWVGTNHHLTKIVADLSSYFGP